MAPSEIMIYRPQLSEDVNVDTLRTIRAEKDAAVIEQMPGTKRVITIPFAPDGRQVQEVSIVCLPDNSETKVTYWTNHNPDRPEPKEISLTDSEQWEPIPTNNYERMYILVRHQDNPGPSQGNRLV